MPVTFIQYIKPLICLTQIFGISFFSLHEYNTDECAEDMFSFLIGLPVICSYIYCSWQAVLDMANLKPRNQNISRYFMKTLCITSIFDFVLATMYNIIYRNKIKSAVYLIQKHVNSNYNKKRYVLIWKIVLMLILCCALYLKDYRGLLIYDIHMHYHIVVKINIYFNFFTTFIHTVYIVEIKREFSNINDSLQQLKNAARNKQIIVGNSTKCTKQWRFKQIIQLVQIHQRLSEVANTVCNTLSFRVLTQITYYFTIMVFGSSPVMRIWRDKDETVNWEWFSWILVGLSWFTLFFIAVSTVCYSWNSIAQEVRKLFY